MLTHLRRSVVSIVVFTVVFGFVYFAGTGHSPSCCSDSQADGSITANGLDAHRPALERRHVHQPDVVQRPPRPGQPARI